MLKWILSKSWSYKETPLSPTESFQKNDYRNLTNQKTSLDLA